MSRQKLDDKNSNKGMVGLGPIPGAAPVAAFNPAQIENLIQTKGFVAIHYKHAYLPDRASLGGGANPNTQAAALRGVVYYRARPLMVIPQQFKLEERLQVQGIFGIGSVLMNVSGNYIDNLPESQVFVRHRDIIVMPTLTTITSQLFEFNPTGPQRLRYKIKGVDYLFDGRGNVYEENVHFSIQNGEIVWENGIGLSKGDVLSCVYYATPIYLVESVPHHIRVIPGNNIGHGAMTREAIYAPQLIVAKPSITVEEENILNFHDLPPYPEYPDGPNITGGSI